MKTWSTQATFRFSGRVDFLIHRIDHPAGTLRMHRHRIMWRGTASSEWTMISVDRLIQILRLEGERVMK